MLPLLSLSLCIEFSFVYKKSVKRIGESRKLWAVLGTTEVLPL